MAKLGFIGLGVMGGQMVNRLLSKGHTVTGYNRTRVQGAVAGRKGNAVGRIAARRRRAADYTFAMVTNAARHRGHH